MVKIVFLGSGNVATNLAYLVKGYSKIVQVYSKNITHAKLLATALKTDYTDNLSDLALADIYIVSVKDDVLEEVLLSLPNTTAIVVHTSGSMSIEVFKKTKVKNYGVFYPLQTFSKNEIEKEPFPICIEASSKTVNQTLNFLANKVASRVYQMSSAQREKVHLAAVFANNFTNHLVHIAQILIEKEGLDSSLVLPLLSRTFEKLKTNHPKQTQTGPAKRRDKKILENHLKQLASIDNHWKDIYEKITADISRHFL